MDDTPIDENDEEKIGKLLSFPGGETVSTNELGTPFVVTGVGSMPTSEPIDSIIVSEELREREAYVRGQELVRVVDGGGTAEIADVLLKEMAEEIGHLKWERKKAAADGKPTTTHNLARVNSLRSMMELLLKKKETSMAERLDLRSPRFQKIFSLIMEFFQDSMEKVGVSGKESDLVFNQIKADMMELEKKLELAD